MVYPHSAPSTNSEFSQMDVQLIHSAHTNSNDSKKSLFWGRITLEVSISIANYIGLLAHYFLLAFIFVTVESLQPMLLQSNFHIEKSQQGSQNANLLLADILTKITFAPVMGALCDRIGRRYTLFYGITIITISLALMPLCSSIYPQLLLIRILFAHGAIAIAIVPLLADYVEDQTKGKGAAINVILASLGAVSSVQVVENSLQSDMSIKEIYWQVGSIYFIAATCVCFLIKNGLYFIQGDEQNAVKKGIKEMLKYGIQKSKNPWIIIGYLTNFFARGDSILLTLFLVLWSNQYVEDYDDANIKAQILSGVAYTVILVFSIFYGILLEKASKYMIHVVMFFLTTLGCVMFSFANDGPTSTFAYSSISVLGCGMSGLFTSSQYLINKYSDRNHRGYITGLANLISVIGIFVCAVIGGYLFDQWTITAPFILFGSMSGIGMLIVILLWLKNKSSE